MNQSLKFVYLLSVVLGITSCGSTEKASDEILRLGGISSTGNKDESSGETQKDSKVPLSPAQICENQLDLSPRVYRLEANTQAENCSSEQRSNSCIVELKFENTSSLAVTYFGHTEASPAKDLAEYNACKEIIQTSLHRNSSLRLSLDQTTITDELLGLVFKLVEVL
jgi:hypothetical protein